MSSDSTPAPASGRNAWARRAALVAVVFVPLSFAGLLVAALGQDTTNTGDIPVAIVNEDTLQTVPQDDGSELNVFAGRQLVTELTGSDGFTWSITNSTDAEEALNSGEVYAILTVPEDFSTSILSLSGTDPQKADLSIRTDDAHSYLVGSVAQVVGETMVDTFGKEITAQYIGGLYSSIGELGEALTAAADGATELSGGASSLSGGLVDYTDGVSSLAYGLSQLSDGAAELSQLSSGLDTYTSGISDLSGFMSTIDLGTVTDPTTAAQLQGLAGGLAEAAAGGETLASEASSGIAGVQSGISQSASGAAELSNNASSLTSGASDLAEGASSLASGLESGAAQVPETDADAAVTAAEIAADPVTLSVTTDNEVSQVGQLVATFFVPLGLWIGALAVFLVLQPITRRALTSTARDGRLVASTIGRAALVTGAQAVLLVALLHLTTEVSWTLLPQTLAFSLLMAIAFTTFHYLLTVGLGRAGLVVSLFLLALQLTSTGGVYPIELLASPFRAVSPLLPLTYAVDGMQGILTGGDPGAVVAAALTLIAFGVLSALLGLRVIRRMRSASSLGLVPSMI